MKKFFGFGKPNKEQDEFKPGQNKGETRHQNLTTEKGERRAEISKRANQYKRIGVDPSFLFRSKKKK